MEIMAGYGTLQGTLPCNSWIHGLFFLSNMESVDPSSYGVKPKMGVPPNHPSH